MKNAIADPNVEQEGENQSGSIGWDTWYGMSASTMQPLTATRNCGIRSTLGKMDEELHSPHHSLWLHLTISTRRRMELQLAQS